MSQIRETSFSDFHTHMLDHGVYHNPDDNKTVNGYEWGFFISADNTRTQQILLSRELVSKDEMDFCCSKLRIPKMPSVY